MYELAILVVLYNKEIDKSSSLMSLVNSRYQVDNTVLVIWNNGPTNLQSLEYEQLTDKGYQVKIVETPTNIGLAKIYNRFCNETKSKRYAFLDDDSTLNSNYLKAATTINIESAGVPIKNHSGKRCGLQINGILYSGAPGKLEGVVNTITAFGSGLVIGDKFLSEIKDIYGEVFDNRFILYAVDTSFFQRINNSKLAKRFVILPEIDHSLSNYKDETEEVKTFRIIENANAYALVIKYYHPALAWKKVALYAIKYTIKRLLWIENDLHQAHFIKTFFRGKHYRD